MDEKILKKHNLKAVPFSCIGEGQTFYIFWSLTCYPGEHIDLERVLSGNQIYYANDHERHSQLDGEINEHADTTVYVPVWRVTERGV